MGGGKKRVSLLCFLYRNPRLSTPEALFRGPNIFLEGALSGTCSSPPPYHGPSQEIRSGAFRRESF